VERQADGLLAEVDLNCAFGGELVAREQSGQLAESLGGAGCVIAAGESLADHHRRERGEYERGGEQPALGQELHLLLLLSSGEAGLRGRDRTKKSSAEPERVLSQERAAP